MIELNGYQIREEIYRNSRRVVYRGIREADGLPVILKTLGTEYPSPTDIAQLHHEYEITQDLKLGGIIEPLSLEISSNLPVLILPDTGGISLKTFLNQQRLDLSHFLILAIKLAQTLGEIHQRHIIHKDIKPSNIIIQPQSLEVKLIDFAIASQLSRETAAAVHPHNLEGTLAYMSPEQTGRMNRAIDYRTDFYSLGVTFYEMLTGQLPYQIEEAIELVHCHIARMPVPPTERVPEIPLAVSNLVMKLLAKNAENRYQSGLGLKTDLEICLKQWQEQGRIDEFKLGEKDFSGQLEIPQKLYGRDREKAQILSAFERVCGGATELMLISGYSGVGKSALVQETQKPLVKHRGYFISGKFDQFKVNIPYAAVIQAFASLVRQLLSEPEAQIKAWNEKILGAIGENGQVIIEVIPEVELIIGPQPALVSLPPTESQNRFNLVFQNFITVFTQKEHPLILFIDDLQWADLASLELIKRVITDSENHHLLMIVSYRDNEVTATHPVELSLQTIKKTPVPVTEINLTPLNVHHVNDLLAETLNCTTAKSFSLAKLIFKKTQGNPFFLTQVLKSLEQDQLLTFNWDKGGWDWQISQIEKIGITENVVELMVSKIQKLQPQTQTALKLAACIGNCFDIEMLSIVNERSPHLTSRDLWEAIQEELILPLAKAHTLSRVREPRPGEKVCYQFLHDRVQQAAYSLIPEGRKKETHWKIAELLLSNTPQKNIEENVFEIVSHFNYSRELITNLEQKTKLARLNLKAGQKALSANAYELADTYFLLGLKLLGQDSWETDYPTTLRLHIQAAYAAYLNTDFERMEDLVKIGLVQAESILDQVNFYEIRIKAYSSCSQQLKALENTQKALELLEIHLPEQPTFADIQVGLNEISNQLAGTNIQDLINLPEMSKAHQKAGMRVLNSAIAPAYQVAPMLLPLIVVQEIKLSLTYGNTDESAYAYACYGLILCGIVGDIETGHQFGQLALKVLEKFNNKELKCRTLMVVNNNVGVWKEPFQDTIPPLLTAYESGLGTGDLEYAGLSVYNYCLNSYLAGKELSKLESEIACYNFLLKKIKQITPLTYCQMSWQVVLNLIHKSDNPVNLVGAAYNEETMLPIHETAGDRYALCCLYLHKLILSYLFRQHQQAVVNARIAATYLDVLTAVYPQPLFYFYDALSALALYLQASEAEQAQILVKVETNQEKMKTWAKFAPANFQQKYELVEAEKARVKGELLEAMNFYDLAIATAQKNNYIQEEALAWELAAEFYEQIGRNPTAGFYRKKAHSCYYRWGALAKVQDLEARFADLNSKTIEVSTTELQTHNYTESKSSGYDIFLDLNTVIQATQALIGEVQLDKLLAKLMRLALENAGAQMGYLLLNQNGNFVIEAAGNIERTEVAVRQAIAVENSSFLPLSLINYVSRTQEDVVLNDANQNDQFNSDPYILATQPKSVLCTPILGQGKLIGILYLENNLLVGAFSPSRVELLKLLSSQAAIALENAQLYQAQKEYSRKLEKQVQERTQQLQQSNTRYYNLAANIPGMMYQFMMHTDGKFTCPYISPGCRKIYGVEAEAAMEDISLLMDLTHPDDRAQHIESITHSATTLEPWHFIGRLIVSGQIKWIQGDANPEPQPDGSILWDGLVVDISDRKQAEEELRKSEERWQLALKGNNDGIWDWNLATNEVFFSPRWKKIIGYEDHELPNDFNEWLQRVHPEDYRRVSQLCQEHLQGNIAFYSTEYRLLCKDGTYKWILDRGQALWDEAGNPVRMAGSNTDISDRKQAEEALRQSEEQFRTLVSSIPGAVYRCLCDHEWTMQYISDFVEEITGYPSASFINNQFQSFGNLIHSEDQELCESIILEAIGLNQPFIVEYRIIHADGSTRWMYEKGQAIRGETEEIIYLSGVIFDVTDRKLAEESLAESERKYRHLVETSQDLIFSTDQSGYFTFVNQAVKQIHGYEPEEMIGRAFTDFQPPEQAAKDIEVFQEIFQTGSLFQYETVHLSKAGKLINFLFNIIIIRDLEGNLIGTTGTASDITQRKQAEKALLQSEAKLQKITANVPGMVYQFHLQVDGSMKFSFVSQGCKALYEWEPQEIVDDVSLIIDTIHPDDLQRFYETVEESAKTLQPWNWEGRFISASGEMKWLQGNSTPEQQANGEIIWYGIVFEITERKRVELVLQEAKKAADAASKAKGEFLSKMSHELRTPLNAILGFTQILNRDNTLQPQQQDYLGIISRAGEHLLTLINDVLEMSKIEAGRISLNETSFDLYRLLTSLEEMFKLKAESKGLQLIFERKPNLPPFIKTDESKLRQVFINLLGNAIKFTDKGGIAVRVTTETQSLLTEGVEGESATYLVCEIEDTGPGIRAEELDTLFDPFVQSETGRKSQSGTGLGLPISRQFVQLMGGKITVSSTLEKGTIFKFDIKISPADAMTPGTEVQRQRVIGLAANQPEYRILVVEDKWESRLLLRNLLSPLGFEVREAVNGEDAVTMWRSWQPHLIWMDMQMPVMDGYEATRQIKQMTNGPLPVIIGLTASAFEENRAMVLEAGCDDFASKPFREDVIFQKMAEHLGVRYLYEEIPGADVSSHSPSVPGDCLTVTECLQGMLPEWKTQLYQAASELDDEAIADLITQIPDSHTALATTLTNLVTQLRFDKIIELIQAND